MYWLHARITDTVFEQPLLKQLLSESPICSLKYLQLSCHVNRSDVIGSSPSLLPSFLNPSILEAEDLASMGIILSSPGWMLSSRSSGSCIGRNKGKTKQKRQLTFEKPPYFNHIGKFPIQVTRGSNLISLRKIACYHPCRLKQ